MAVRLCRLLGKSFFFFCKILHILDIIDFFLSWSFPSISGVIWPKMNENGMFFEIFKLFIRGQLIWNIVYYDIKSMVIAIRYRGEGRVCFFTPPLFCPAKFVKSSDQFFGKKARRRRKNFEVPFFKKLMFLEKFNRF